MERNPAVSGHGRALELSARAAVAFAVYEPGSARRAGGVTICRGRRTVLSDVAAMLAHLSCAALGGAIAVLFAAPRIGRRATSIAAVLATLVGLVAISGPLREIGGPVAAAAALTDAGAISGDLLLACLSCVAATTLTLGVACLWARHSD